MDIEILKMQLGQILVSHARDTHNTLMTLLREEFEKKSTPETAEKHTEDASKRTVDAVDEIITLFNSLQ